MKVPVSAAHSACMTGVAHGLLTTTPDVDSANPSKLKSGRIQRRSISPTPSDDSTQDATDAMPAFVPACLRSGVAAEQNRRHTMEDASVIEESLAALSSLQGKPGTTPAALYAVFDGHNGPQAAQFAAERITEGLAPLPATDSPALTMVVKPPHPRSRSGAARADIGAALCQSFLSIDHQYYRATRDTADSAGTTALAVVVWGSRVVVANAGDSRAVLCRAGKAVELTTDHKPHVPEERQRIEASGGFVCAEGLLCGELGVARAIGDYYLQPVLKSIPATPTGARAASSPVWELMETSATSAGDDVAPSTPLAEAPPGWGHAVGCAAAGARALGGADEAVSLPDAPRPRAGAGGEPRADDASHRPPQARVAPVAADADQPAVPSGPCAHMCRPESACWQPVQAPLVPASSASPQTSSTAASGRHVAARVAGPLIAEPEVTRLELSPLDEFVLLACDGLFDVMSSQRAVELARTSLREHNHPQQCAEELVAEAIRRHSSDNVTVLVVCLGPDPPKRRTYSASALPRFSAPL